MANSQEVSTTASRLNCKEKEGTSFTLIVDNMYPWYYVDSVSNLVSRVLKRFPCVQRHYNLIRVNHSAISERVADTKEDFVYNLNDYNFWDYYFEYFNSLTSAESYTSYFCNHTLLHGIRRALEISPPESFILTLSGGSVIDQNNTEILAETYRLLNEKKSQVFFINYDHCASELPEDTLREITKESFGHYSKRNMFSISEASYGLDLFLLKPLNSSLHIFNVDIKSFSQYREEFYVQPSLKFLMITTNGFGIFNITDPDGNRPILGRTLSYISGNTVKFPVSGIWTLEVFCYDVNEFCSISISGFTGLESAESCSNSDCDPNASCEEFGGYQECTCSTGFHGDGSICHDINECENFYLNYCNGNCTNTIGSFDCICSPGSEYVKNEGCIDINECLNHDCHPLATCTNYYGSYSCTCLSGYYGDGKHCEVECDASLEPPGCFDPCFNYTGVYEQWRLTNADFDYFLWYQCDYSMSGWYRFQGRTELKIPEHCIKQHSCGTQMPLWINGTHPRIEDGTVNATVCASWDNCCTWTHPISIRACPDGYYVYKIQGTASCFSAYCTEPLMSNQNCSVYCASDEECITAEGKSECHCKNNYGPVHVTENNLYPDLVCGSSQIELTYSKCTLERMGYDTSSIYLKDRMCRGLISREEKSYVKIRMSPRYGYCGAELKINKTHVTYANSVYLSQQFHDTIQRNPAIVNFYCSYPLDMEVSLWTALNPVISAVNFSIGGTGLYTAKMALYQDSGFSIPFKGSDVWLNTDSMLYVGVIVEEIQEPNFVLLMKNCYATPTNDSGHPIKYYIIKDNCPNRNDPSISVEQNGLSLHGQFSVQVFRFIGNYDQVYLHCQIKLCNTLSGSCTPVSTPKLLKKVK
ncbi:uromodulin-like [Dendropsophus ebraccatus]|uniref:uromodulin-like n=1 Tax=Dendropsophus ebraccatus TaxID=150705 RepID=UPI0038311718